MIEGSIPIEMSAFAWREIVDLLRAERNTVRGVYLTACAEVIESQLAAFEKTFGEQMPPHRLVLSVPKAGLA